MGPGAGDLTPPRGGPLSPALEAALYDWHNAARLRTQAADGPYWARVLHDARSIVVLGAGTGRVALALRRADRRRRLIAVDLSAARLARMPAEADAEVVVADFRRLRLEQPVDAAIFPYSSFQLLPDAVARAEAIGAAAGVLVEGGTLALDVSTSFDRRSAHAWTRTLTGESEELHASVEEWERVEREPNALLISQRYRVGGHDVGETSGRWAYHAALDVPRLLAAAGLALVGVDEGYAPGIAPHRRLYVARRLVGPATGA